MSLAGCPACRLARLELNNYFRFLREGDHISSGAIRRLRYSRGYCHRHGLELASGLREGRAKGIYWEVSARAEAELRRLLPGSNATLPPRRNYLHRALGRQPHPFRPMGRCPACALEEQSQDRAITALICLLQTHEGRDLYSQRDGACIRHIIQLVQKAPSQVVSIVTGHAANRMHALLGEIREYFRKEDYRYAHEPKAEEQTAWLRAFHLLGGQ